MQVLFCYSARGVALPAHSRGYLKWKHLPQPSIHDDSGSIWTKWQIPGWRKRSLAANAWAVYKSRVVYLVSLQLVSIAAQLASPLVLQYLLQLLEQPTKDQSATDKTTMYILAAGLYLTTALSAVVKHKYWFDASRVGIHWCASQSVAVLDTAIHRAVDSEAAASSVNLANLVTVDAQRVQNTAAVPFGVWALLTTIVTNLFASYWLWHILSWPGLAATGLCWVTPLFAQVLSNHVRDTTGVLQQKRDARSNAAKTALGSVLTLKTFTWADSWLDRILHLRGIEHSALVQMLLASSLVTFVGRVLPSFASVTAFSLYVFVLHEPLLPSKAFAALVWYNMLYSSTAMLGHLLSTVAKVQASLQRVQEYTASADTHLPVPHPAQLNPLHESKLQSQAFASSSLPHGVLVAAHDCTWGYPLPPTAPPHSPSSPPPPREALDTVPFQVYAADLKLPEQGLVVVFGPVGSGKSSLLRALAGELVHFRGIAHGNAHCAKAYMQQPPWLGNVSVQENVCLLDPYFPARYSAVCQAAGLAPVLGRVAEAAAEAVGEAHASALSGGERARVALARCLYSTAPAMLLDDPLSALDADTRQSVWRDGILAAAATRCVVVAVSQLPPGCSVPNSAQLYSLSAGVVTECDAASGSFPFEIVQLPLQTQLGQLPLPPLQEADESSPLGHSTAWAPVDDSDSDGEDVPNVDSVSKSLNAGGAAGDELSVPLLRSKTRSPQRPRRNLEHNTRGGIGCHVIMEYLRSFLGLFAVGCLLFSLLAQDILQLGCSWLLASWTTDIQQRQNTDHFHEGNSSHPASPAVATDAFGSKFALLGLADSQYGALYAGGWGVWGATQAVVLLLTSLGAATAGTTLHNRMMRRLLHAPAAFFVSTPLGRLMNRAVADVQTIDSNIVWSLLWFFKNVQQVLLATLTMGYTNPWTLLGLPPLALLYTWFAVRYRVAARDLRRIGSSLRSPLLSQMHVLIDGGAVLRSAKRTEHALQRYMALLSNVTHSSMTSWALQQWITVSLELLAAVLILVTCLLAVQEHARGGMAAAEIGFVLSFLLTLPQNLYWLVRNFTKVEIDMVAAERVIEYSNVQHESEWWNPRILDSATPATLSSVVVHARAPSTESLELKFRNFQVAYEDDSPPVLSIDELCIPAGCKLAVVGASGSGKTTLARALFGFVKHSGTVLLGEQGLGNTPLPMVRQLVGGLLQDSSVWSGSVLDNLYPLPAAGVGSNAEQHAYTPAQVAAAKAAVMQVALWNDLLGVLPDGLHGQLSDGGAPLSAGQRQLLLLARFQLHHRAVLVVDEASSHADEDTERVIVDTVLRSSSTVLFIAHRTKHLHLFDAVLRLGSGRVLSYGPPSQPQAVSDE